MKKQQLIILNPLQKINLNLNILRKNKINQLHDIESLVALIDLADDIEINEIKSKKHKVIFKGKFSNGISKNNTVTHLLKLLEREKILKKKYKILIKKYSTAIRYGRRINERCNNFKFF